MNLDDISVLILQSLFLIALAYSIFDEAKVGLAHIEPFHYFYKLVILSDVFPTFGRDRITGVPFEKESILGVVLLL